MENNKIDLILNDDNISTKSKKKLEPLKKTTIREPSQADDEPCEHHIIQHRSYEIFSS